MDQQTVWQPVLSTRDFSGETNPSSEEEFCVASSEPAEIKLEKELQGDQGSNSAADLEPLAPSPDAAGDLS